MNDDLKKTYERAEPPAYRAHGGDSEIFRKIKKTEAWARTERLGVARNIAANREIWLKEERQKEALTRQMPSLDYEPPMAKKSIEQVARERISLKVQGMMANVEAERARRIEDITKLPHATHANAPELRAPNQTDSAALNAKTNDIQKRAGKIRIKARVHFNRMRPLFIADAAASGSDTPVKDVHDNQTKRLHRIDRAEDSLLGQAFRSHGVTRERGPTRNEPTMA